MMRLAILSSSCCLFSYSSSEASCELSSQLMTSSTAVWSVLVSSVELVSELLVGERVTEVVDVGLETILGGDTSSGSVILN